MKFFKKCALIIFRYIVIVGVYFLFKLLTFETFTVKRGVVVNSGYYKYTNGRQRYSYSFYPIVAFKAPGDTQKQDPAELPSPFDEVGNRVFQVGNIYFTHPSPGWHYDELSSKGDSMDYYYVNGDVGNAKVLSLYSYWLPESGVYWMILGGVIWTVIADLRRIGKEEKINKSVQSQ